MERCPGAPARRGRLWGKWFVVLLAATLASKAAAAADDQRTPPVDLPALIECRAQVRDYNSLGFKIAGNPEVTKEMGWVEVKQANPFLREYRLPKAIVVFG